MRAIMVMYDTLCKRMLPNWGCDEVIAPNFARLGEHAVAFDRCYVGSMPCIPARRELHTGRYNFLHGSWGPIQPFDDSVPAMLKERGVHSHLVSDHYHYWEDGGATYHERFATWEGVRGQEGDPWRCDLDPSIRADCLLDDLEFPGVSHEAPIHHRDAVDRRAIRAEADFPQAKTFDAGLRFLETNCAYDGWFLQIETFDPHEPFFAPQSYRDLYPDALPGCPADWPPSRRATGDEKVRQHIRSRYLALLSLCDRSLGRVLDFMDAHDMWKDTMLIVCTDHGYMLGEHGWWGKNIMPFYDEIANTPLFIWDPRSGAKGEHRRSLVQTIDLPCTLLDYFGLAPAPDMEGHALRDTVARDAPVRENALFGMFGGGVNITDGRYVYMRAPRRAAGGLLFEYTLMPMHMNGMYTAEELRRAELAPPFPHTKGCPQLKIPATDFFHVIAASMEQPDALYDLETDPGQRHPVRDEAVERRLTAAMAGMMRKNGAPREQFVRMGLERE